MKKNKNPKLGYIIATNKSYGRLLKGTKIYFEGKKPKALKKDGSIQFGKNILEKLKRRFGDNFKLVITQSEDSIKKEIRYHYVRISQKTLSSISSKLIMQKKDIKNEILDQKFPKIFPEFFESNPDARPYVPGSLAKFLSIGIISKLSAQDKEAVVGFIPDFIASESVASVNLIKAEAQIESLKELAEEMKKAIESNKSESWWQSFIKSNILIIQQGYIKAFEKINTGIGGTNFPDFCLVTHDNYLDILEIKRPNTNLLKPDDSRGNYYWDTEISKAIIQTENYIKNVSHHADSIRNYIKDTHKIDLQVLRPRGVILVGDNSQFKSQKENDDFRLLSQGVKNITFVTYSELLSRLLNYIQVLEGFRSKTS